MNTSVLIVLLEELAEIKRIDKSALVCLGPYEFGKPRPYYFTLPDGGLVGFSSLREGVLIGFNPV